MSACFFSDRNVKFPFILIANYVTFTARRPQIWLTSIVYKLFFYTLAANYRQTMKKCSLVFIMKTKN